MLHADGNIRTNPRICGVVQTLVIGGGPAGVAMLTAASKDGRIDQLGTAGLVLVERSDTVGAGQLGRYAINSDTTAETFLTAIADNPYSGIQALASHPSTRGIIEHEGGLGVPLARVGPFLEALGEQIARVASASGGVILTRHEALGSRRGTDGVWRTQLRRLSDDHVFEAASRNLVIATGGYQSTDWLAEYQVGGESLVAQAGDRLLQSDQVLAVGGYEALRARIGDRRAPKIAVIGSSTSAVATVGLLLRERPALPFGAGAISLLHRRPLRPFYRSVEAALKEGFTDFGPDDICPVLGAVYLLAGFRLEARELVLRMLGVDGRAPEPRVRLHRIAPGEDASARAAIAEADLVISCLGYRPRGFPVEEADGRRIALAGDTGAPMVDSACRVLGSDGAAVPHLYGIGLAAGFRPAGALSGERSFRGQINGLWQWQNNIGRLIVDAVLNG